METYRIGEDAEVRLEFTGDVTQEAIDKLIAYLELSQDTYPTRDKAPEGDAAAPVETGEGEE